LAAKNPLVSVVIPTRGRPELLLETLATITGQDYAGTLEVVVVHDREEVDPTLRRTQHRGAGVPWRLRGEL
jgi:glycosyltransferase involved in cell wall biosynthesis